MGGYRARGALATLALSLVVLVAVLLAGTVSMAPIGSSGNDPLSARPRNNSFDIVIPGEVQPPAQDPDPGTAPGDTPTERIVVLDEGGQTRTQGGSLLPPSPIPPGFPGTVDGADPVGGPVPPGEPGDPNEPNEPVEPVDPVDPVDPGEPTPLPTEPQPPAPGEEPTPPVAPPPPREPVPRAAPGRGAAGQPPIVIIEPRSEGPKWRPQSPARQTHPKDDDKWTRAQPRLRPEPQRSGPSERSAKARAHGTRREPPRASPRRTRTRPSVTLPQPARSRGEADRVRHAPRSQSNSKAHRRNHRGDKNVSARKHQRGKHGHGGKHRRGRRAGRR